MARFRNNDKKEAPGISSGSLSDIVFMLLFFFMVTKQMRESENKVEVKLASATEITKLERKDLTSFILIGKPIMQETYGKSDRIQLNGDIITEDQLGIEIIKERSNIAEKDRKDYRIAIRADEGTKMRIIRDVKLKLREVSALKLMYQTKRDQSSGTN